MITVIYFECKCCERKGEDLFVLIKICCVSKRADGGGCDETRYDIAAVSEGRAKNQVCKKLA